MSLETIRSDFEFLDDWEDRYRYVIELGRALQPLAPSEKTDLTKVRGCASQVWLIPEHDPATGRFVFRGESDAHIVQGLIAILLAIYNDRTAAEILSTDAHGIFAELGLNEHLTPQRSNGLKSMINRIQAIAEAVA
jgi:cysteine desulfuration protein SufE